MLSVILLRGALRSHQLPSVPRGLALRRFVLTASNSSSARLPRAHNRLLGSWRYCTHQLELSCVAVHPVLVGLGPWRWHACAGDSCVRGRCLAPRCRSTTGEELYELQCHFIQEPLMRLGNLCSRCRRILRQRFAVCTPWRRRPAQRRRPRKPTGWRGRSPPTCCSTNTIR